MRPLFILPIAIFSLVANANNATSNVITCFDVMNDDVSRAARSLLHKQAQKRAQDSIESFIEKPVLKPYVDAFGRPSQPENMASVIEVYWCDARDKPLHSAYYDFYSRNKSVFGK
ncbi:MULTISPECIES: hypothetical protein [Vibrio harveyi group]|uniref:hypothetical protein n=1 Tax=Vibrio harveyi group TaxID=717610 RepID=UPI001783E519|nr:MULTISPECIES: hypothetical protein [Vibrio harveyi group]MBD6945398.1 hypothetical protein [Vibrio parahaemolyticus]MBD6958535.1 hypothetical protein [Vibrio parahaemolyticus]MBD6978444.1 hypothetical protein [Vibrio parahaemolyticus]MBD6992948.1 hypothetical protein [Vibrio parahaemolyticus]MCR9939681.1 hypothetical protein [Vibrio owensii]